MKDYAIIIPAFNEEALLSTTLTSVRAAMNTCAGEGELIVVDNNSTDQTAAIARENGADQVVFEPHNQIARARNAGAAATTAPFLIFIDADTTVPAETLRQALDLLRSGQIAGGGARIRMDQPVGLIMHFFLSNWNRVSKWFQYAAGSFFFCRRDAFEAAGGFEEKVYAGEEIYFARKIKTWGKKRNLRFQIIQDPPVETSARKSDWYSGWDFTRQLMLIFLFPWLARQRRFCGLWYRRPSS
jgi:glycosyltransferase involved in cell wall biosynthesis